jgi:hypothetical protein
MNNILRLRKKNSSYYYMKDKHKSDYAKKNKAKRVAKSLTKNQKQEVKKLATLPLESKYVSDIDNVNEQSEGINNFINTTTNWYPIIPSVLQGTAQNQRAGNSISDCYITCKWDFRLLANANLTQHWRVKLFILESKRVKSYYNMFDATGNKTVIFGNLLNKGDGTMTNWQPPAGVGDTNADQYIKMPVNTDDFIVKKTHTFDLVKNVGQPNLGLSIASTPGLSDVSISPNIGSKHNHHIEFKIKYKKLLYDNTLYDPLPGNYATNHALFYYVVAYDPNFNTLPGSVFQEPAFTFRSDMHYKDG